MMYKIIHLRQLKTYKIGKKYVNTYFTTVWHKYNIVLLDQ